MNDLNNIFGTWLVANSVVGAGLFILLWAHNFICWAVEYTTRPRYAALDRVQKELKS